MVNQGNNNIITTGPELADVDIVDYYSNLQSSTNYVETIIANEDTTYVSDAEVQTAFAYRDAFRQGDVIGALNNFAANIQDKVFNDETVSFDTILFWYQKIKNSNRELISLGTPGSTFGDRILPNLRPSVSSIMSSGFLTGLNLQQSFFDIGSIVSLGNILNKSNSINGNLLGGVTSTLSNIGIPVQSFLESVSDSVGTLVNTKYIQTDSTLPIFDISQEYYGVPIPYSASTESKISNNTRNIAYNLSRSTTALMRRNLVNIAYTMPALTENMATDATVAHGQNLINDLPTFVNINNTLPDLLAVLSSRFVNSRTFQFIQYISNIGNNTAFNLRDIFPVQPGDRDFTVITTRDRAAASAQEMMSISDNAIVDAYLQQQGMNYSGQNYSATTAALLGPAGTVDIFNSNNKDQNKNITNYLNGISYLETDNDPKVASGVEAGNTGFFRFNQQDADRAAAAGLPDPRAGTYEQQSAATWAWIQRFNPTAAEAIKSGNYSLATQRLNKFWVSLPGSGQQQQSAKRYTEWNAILQGNTKNNIPIIVS